MLEVIERHADRYDPDALAVLRARLGSGDTPAQPSTREVKLADVAEGMVFAADVHGGNGVLLIARGQEVTPSVLQLVRSHWADLASKTCVRVIMPAA